MSLRPPQCLDPSRNDTCVIRTRGPEALYRSAIGMNITVDSPGATTGFEYLDYVLGIGVPETKYFGGLADALRTAGYINEKTLFGFPYDWRLPPWEVPLDVMKETIEKAVRQTGHRAIIISHSLGSVLTNYFLNTQVDKKWKDAHIEAFVSVNGAFGGSPKVVRCFLTGYDGIVSKLFKFFEIEWIPQALTRSFVRTMGSMYALVPSPTVYAANTPLLRVVNGTQPAAAERGGARLPGRDRIEPIPDNELSAWQYFAKRVSEWTGWLYKKIFDWGEDEDDAKLHEAQVEAPLRIKPGDEGVYTPQNWTSILPAKMEALVHQASQHVQQTLTDPEVPVMCLWSKYAEASTDRVLTYNSNDLEALPAVGKALGDNTLPLESLRWCTRWQSTKLAHEIADQDHMAILRSDDFIKYVVQLVTRLPGGF